MTEMQIRPEDVKAAIERTVSEFKPATAIEEVGRVAITGDGIARVEGLPSAMVNELLEFEGGLLGVALNLDVREIGTVLLGESSHVAEGQPVRRTGRVLSVPVGDGFLGRVVDAIGKPIDGLGPIKNDGERALEIQAPTVVQRQPVKEPLETGIKAVDAMTAIGRGQRQLIIGDRQTGKTAIALDAIINQKANWKSGDKKRQVKCIYVAIGQKGSTIAAVKGALEEAGALEYTTIVAAPASDPAGYKYLAPYTGSAIGQYWIYLHSRLLERCAKLSDELGAGSMTGLPIIETKGNDVSAYIPTNVISITDGQCFLETDLFNSGVRPAINVGISVSRVGGSAQPKSMKKVAGRLRLDLAQFRELESFAAFGSDLDAASKAAIARGSRLVELLKQPQYAPFSMEKAVVSMWAGTTGRLDEVPVPDVRRFEAEFLAYLESQHASVMGEIRDTRDLSDANIASLVSAIDAFKKTFMKSDGTALITDEQFDALSESDIKKNTITRDVRN